MAVLQRGNGDRGGVHRENIVHPDELLLAVPVLLHPAGHALERRGENRGLAIGRVRPRKLPKPGDRFSVRAYTTIAEDRPLLMLLGIGDFVGNS